MRSGKDDRPIPPHELHGRLRYTAHFVHSDDIAGRMVLNVGCGFGWFELYALSMSVGQVVGIEPSLSDLAVALRHIQDERVTFAVGSALRLPFASGTFDTVTCWEVIEHVPEGAEGACLNEFRRVLKPGGVLYLSTPADSLPSTVLDPAHWLIGHRHYSQKQLFALADESRFAMNNIATVGRWWDILSWWNLYIAKWVLRRRPLLERRLNQCCDREIFSGDGFTDTFCRMLTRDELDRPYQSVEVRAI